MIYLKVLTLSALEYDEERDRSYPEEIESVEDNIENLY
jgi:hypothetical protein